MSGSRADFRVESDFAAMVHEPLGTGAQIFFVLRLCGDAGEAEVIAEFRDKAGLVLFQVIKDNLHGIS
jgi:hypothetical protein